MELLQNLGIDGKALVWQMVNFAILFFIFKKYLFGPILNKLDTRRNSIETSLKQAKEIEVRLKQAETEHGSIIEQAKKEAQGIREQAKLIAEQEAARMVERTKQDIAQLIVQAKESIKVERGQMLQEAKEKFTELVIRATRTVTTELVDKQVDEVLVKKALEKI